MTEKKIVKKRSTGIGSLPFTDAREAVVHTFDSYDIPFFPQLPHHARYQLREDPQMLQEALTTKNQKVILDNEPGVFTVPSRKECEAHLEALPGWKDFLELLRERQPPSCKLQLAAPQTVVEMIQYVRGGMQAPVSYQSVAESLLLMARLMIEQTHDAAPSAHILFFWDGPVPQSTTDADHLIQIFEAIESDSITCGFHSCAPFLTEQLEGIVKNRYFACDLGLFIRNYGDQAKEQLLRLKEICKAGGIVAGVINTNIFDGAYPDKDILIEVAESMLIDLNYTPDCANLPLLVSPACGTGLLDETFEKNAAKALRDISAR